LSNLPVDMLLNMPGWSLQGSILIQCLNPKNYNRHQVRVNSVVSRMFVFDGTLLEP